MSIQRQHFLLSYLIKDPECWSGRGWTRDLPHGSPVRYQLSEEARGGGGSKTLLFPEILTEGLGMIMHVHCHMTVGHVTLLGTFEFAFWSAESFAEVPWKCVKFPHCFVLGHLLVPELIIKGWEGLNLLNFKELLIGTVKVTNFVQMLDSSYWQFVVHGQGAVKQMSLISPGYNLHLWKFHWKLKVAGQLLVQDSSLVRDVVRK